MTHAAPSSLEDVHYSPSWGVGPAPRIAAVISSFRRPQFLQELLVALSVQTLPREQYEIVVVDNGSRDRTWDTLKELADDSPARLAVTRLSENRGPGGGRNHGFRYVRAAYAAVTDDDCLPSPEWLATMLSSLEADADIVQGQVRAEPTPSHAVGPWDHTKWITAPTPFFETCNVGYRVSRFEAAGGYDESDPLTARVSGRAFGEDAVLAARIVDSGGRPAFSENSLVYHRNVSADFTQWLRDRRNLVGFPGLGNRSTLVARWYWHRVFLTRDTATFDLAVLSCLVAFGSRRPWLAVGALPWLWLRWPEARHRARGDLPVSFLRLSQLALADGVSLVSLVEGSVRHRRVLL